MKKIILEKLIFKNYLKTSLTSILFIELALVILYFYVNNQMISKNIEFILGDIKKTTYTIVEKETKSIENKFLQIEKLATLLQNHQQNFFENPQNYSFANSIKFDKAENGMFYKLYNNGGSSVVVSKNTLITPSVKKKLHDTEGFDVLFKSIVDNNDSIVAAYFNSHDDINRYYPFIPNSFNAFPMDIKMENYNFYYEANLEHNPEKKAVWTDVYLDPAGQGWMLSSIVPIYNKDFLEGVTGLDVTINKFIRNILSIKIPYEGSSFVLGRDGKIVAMPKNVQEILHIKDIEAYTYGENEKIKTTIKKSDSFTILNHHDETIARNFENIINGKSYKHDIVVAGKEYLLFSKKIERTSWFIISLVSKEKILLSLRDLEKEYKNLGYLIIVFIVVFYLIFFLFLLQQARAFVSQINTPLKKIIKMTKHLGTKRETELLNTSSIVELDELCTNFNNLSQKLDKRTQKLIESETQRFINQELANTDALTGVYNRRFLHDFSEQYIQIVKRENTSFTLLLMDIDKFKNINDSYGHSVGDDVLKKLVEILKGLVRRNDVVVRLGGDEFVIVLPNTSIDNAKEVAHKIIDTFNDMLKNNHYKYPFTVSIGIAKFEHDKDNHIEDILAKADKALYQAKKNGRNGVSQ